MNAHRALALHLDSMNEDTRPMSEQCATVLRYCDDPAFRAELDAETAANRARANASIDAAMTRFLERKYGDGR